MRFIIAAVAAIAAVVAAQNNAISIPNGQSTLSVTAGQPLTIDWTDPSPGTVTIKLQQDPVTPEGGITLASGVPASDLTATLQIPDGADLNAHLYTIEIIDDTDTSNINFSPNFGVTGATGTAVATASTASVTGTSSIGLSTSSASDSITVTSTGSSSATATDSSSTQSSSATTTSDDSSSSTSSSASATESTTAPNSGNGAGSLKVQGSLLAAAIGLIAVM